MIHYFGAHIKSFKEDIINGINDVKNAGGNLAQIMLTLPGDTKAKSKSIDELNDIKEYAQKNDMMLVVHSAYIHNIAKPWDLYSWWLKNLELEIKYSHQLGAYGLVLHIGKQMDLSVEEAYNNMYSFLVFLHSKTMQYKNLLILLETSTGQGSEMCHVLEEFAYFYQKISKNENKEFRKRIKICLDTCHIFASGYDIRTKKDITNFLEKFEDLIGIRHIKLIHLNDSMMQIGEHKDRHQNIGNGYIGLNALKIVFNYFKKLNVPVVLETPENGYRREIKLLLE